ncbi:DUF4270 family protein [Pontibacter sp. H259]|uniref:DUF4270 family protein n=1 Tax=Pontibacter sp. H259 TaxID=3133421 RepID=UPI0030C06BC8
MNSAVRRFTLFFFSLATLASCEDPSDIGLDLQDDNEIGAFYTELAVNSGTVLKPDSVLSFKQQPLPVGGYQDATLGNVKATAFTEVGLSGLDVKFGDNPVADSIVLSLDYTTDIYANNTVPLTLNIHRLTEGFQDKASYFTNSSLNYDSDVLGTVTFDPKVLRTKKTDQDSIAPVNIKLDIALANEILAQSGKEPLKDQFKFVQFFKGIAIVPTQQSPREIFALNTGSNRTKLTLYYKNGTEKKDYTFTMSGSNVRNFSNITANRSGTVLENLSNYEFLPSTATGGETYVQAGTQLFTKLTIPELANFKAENGDSVVINRAELVVPIKSGSIATLSAPQQLAIYETNNSNRILYTSKGEAKTVPADNPSFMDVYTFPTRLEFKKKSDTEGNYTVNLTAYVQAILRGDKPNDGLLITPAKYVGNTSGGGTIANESIPKRAILSNTAEKGVKLRIYYSKLK